MNKIRYLALLVFVVVLPSCTSIGLRVLNAPTAFASFDKSADISFSNSLDLGLDVYAPKGAKANAHPVIVFFYGGRWTTGAKEDYAFVAHRFVNLGYVVVVADYRKYPDVKFPAFVEDAALAVSWTHKNIAEYGGRADQMFLLGHSAGAHIGALLATDERYLNDDIKIAGFAGLAGPYDFTPKEDDLVDMFGPPSRFDQMRVTSFIEGNEPPMLLLYGAQDDLVAQFNLDRLKAKIGEEGGDVESIIYPEFDHIDLVTVLSWVKDKKNRVASDIDRFFRKQLP